MNLQQINYVLAVSDLLHFERAAEKCYITQSTLSTMIARFEDEVGIQIFDRKRKPLKVTAEGEIIIEQLKKIQKELDQLSELSYEIKGEIRGKLSLSVIPTVAPFLLPLFLQEFALKFPNLKIEVKEQTTAEILKNLKNRTLDVGILSIPIADNEIKEIKLYDEPFMFYDSSKDIAKNINTTELDTNNVCLLEEGHCMRIQVLDLCKINKANVSRLFNFEYKAGSIESLLKFVKANKASTFLPYFSTLDFHAKEQSHLSKIINPIPVRGIGLVVHKHFVKNKILEVLREDITSKVNPLLPKENGTTRELSPINFKN